jgi:hypothetical protein
LIYIHVHILQAETENPFRDPITGDNIDEADDEKRRAYLTGSAAVKGSGRRSGPHAAVSINKDEEFGPVMDGGEPDLLFVEGKNTLFSVIIFLG